MDTYHILAVTIPTSITIIIAVIGWKYFSTQTMMIDTKNAHTLRIEKIRNQQEIILFYMRKEDSKERKLNNLTIYDYR